MGGTRSMVSPENLFNRLESQGSVLTFGYSEATCWFKEGKKVDRHIYQQFKRETFNNNKLKIRSLRRKGRGFVTWLPTYVNHLIWWPTELQIKFRIPQHVSVRCIYATINFQRVHQLRDKSGHFASHWFAICKFGTLRRCRYIAPKTDPVSNVIPLNPCLACQRQRLLITAPANINNSFFKQRNFFSLALAAIHYRLNIWTTLSSHCL